MYSQYAGLNVGSGQHYADGWYNTDIVPTDKGQQPDLLADIHDYSTIFPPKAFKKAYVGHVLEHIEWDRLTDAIQSIAAVAEEIMVVGPCIDLARAREEPQSLIDAIAAPDNIDAHPWAHKWTPTTGLTAEAITLAGFTPNVIPVNDVRKPDWPNPTRAGWQCAMWFRS